MTENATETTETTEAQLAPGGATPPSPPESVQLTAEQEDVLEDAVAFAGVAKFPARVKCALLGWMAWKDATARAVEGSTA